MAEATEGDREHAAFRELVRQASQIRIESRNGAGIHEVPKIDTALLLAIHAGNDSDEGRYFYFNYSAESPDDDQERLILYVPPNRSVSWTVPVVIASGRYSYIWCAKYPTTRPEAAVRPITDSHKLSSCLVFREMPASHKS